MKLKTFFNTLIISAMCIASMTSQLAFAEEYPIDDTAVIDNTSNGEEVQPYAAGLITSFYISIVQTSGKNITFVGTTNGSSTMASIGLKNVYVQRSLDCVSWENEINLGNLLKSNAVTYSDETTVTVEGGYYYRISANHYAKKSTLSTQSVSNTSGSVYVY